MQDPVQGAVDAVHRRLGERSAEYWVPIVRGFATLPKSAPALRAIARAPSAEEVRDRLAEIGYCALFLHVGLDLEIEPLGGKGPDARIEMGGSSALVEVTRFRKMHGGPVDLAQAPGDPRLGEYGDIDRDWGKAREKILKKFRQVRGGTSVIAIWNDDGDLEELEVELAVRGLVEDEAADRTPIPSGLMFVLYGSRWIKGSTGRQFHLFPVEGDEFGWDPLFRFARWSEALDALARRALGS